MNRIINEPVKNLDNRDIAPEKKTQSFFKQADSDQKDFKIPVVQDIKSAFEGSKDKESQPAKNESEFIDVRQQEFRNQEISDLPVYDDILQAAGNCKLPDAAVSDVIAGAGNFDSPVYDHTAGYCRADSLGGNGGGCEYYHQRADQ